MPQGGITEWEVLTQIVFSSKHKCQNLRELYAEKRLFYFICFLELHPQHMEVPRLGVESELQLPAYATAHGNTGSLTH